MMWLGIFSLGMIQGILTSELMVDHWVLNGTVEEIPLAVGFSRNVARQPYPFSIVLPFMLFVFSMDLAYRYFKYKKNSDLISFGETEELFLFDSVIHSVLVLAATAMFGQVGVDQQEMGNTSVSSRQGELAYHIAILHLLIEAVISLILILQLKSHREYSKLPTTAGQVALMALHREKVEI